MSSRQEGNAGNFLQAFLQSYQVASEHKRQRRKDERDIADKLAEREMTKMQREQENRRDTVKTKADIIGKTRGETTMVQDPTAPGGFRTVSQPGMSQDVAQGLINELPPIPGMPSASLPSLPPNAMGNKLSIKMPQPQQPQLNVPESEWRAHPEIYKHIPNLRVHPEAAPEKTNEAALATYKHLMDMNEANHGLSKANADLLSHAATIAKFPIQVQPPEDSWKNKLLSMAGGEPLYRVTAGAAATTPSPMAAPVAAPTTPIAPPGPNGREPYFETEQEAEQAAKAGHIKNGDQVRVGKQLFIWQD